jgi:hypothetical protein
MRGLIDGLDCAGRALYDLCIKPCGILNGSNVSSLRIYKMLYRTSDFNLLEK